MGCPIRLAMTVFIPWFASWVIPREQEPTIPRNSSSMGRVMEHAMVHHLAHIGVPPGISLTSWYVPRGSPRLNP